MSKNAPVLRTRIIPAHDPHFYNNPAPLNFTVYGGLYYLNGNSAPHFSLTCWYHRVGSKHRDEGGGAAHHIILAHFPELSDLAALHLSDIDGIPPLHTTENGWYDLAGALGGCDVEFHRGNARTHMPKAVVDSDKPWDTTDYRYPTPDECLGMFAKHMRIGFEEAKAIRARLMEEFTVLSPENRAAVAKGYVSDLVDEYKPRWKREAQACIARHGLIVFGDSDSWPVPGA